MGGGGEEVVKIWDFVVKVQVITKQQKIWTLQLKIFAYAFDSSKVASVMLLPLIEEETLWKKKNAASKRREFNLETNCMLCLNLSQTNPGFYDPGKDDL